MNFLFCLLSGLHRLPITVSRPTIPFRLLLASGLSKIQWLLFSGTFEHRATPSAPPLGITGASAGSQVVRSFLNDRTGEDHRCLCCIQSEISFDAGSKTVLPFDWKDHCELSHHRYDQTRRGERMEAMLAVLPQLFWRMLKLSYPPSCFRFTDWFL